MKIFVYGTLMDADVRELVCGKPVDTVEPAIAQGFRRVYVAGRHYPMLLPRVSGWVDGILVSGLDAATMHRLQVYEGWEYTLHPLKVRTASGAQVKAHVFLCPAHITAHKRDWRLAQWQLRHKRTFLPHARVVMAMALKMGRLPGTPMGRQYRPRPGLAPRPVAQSL